MMKMMDCPRWHSCNAPICPFWSGGVHRNGEATCYYVREFYKANAQENFEKSGVEHIYNDLKELAPKVVASSKLIRKEVERAAKTNSRLSRSGTKGANTEKGVNGNVTESRVGKGIAKDTYNPIPLLPVAENGIPERELTGDSNQCRSCNQWFNSTAAFDKHRTGNFDGSRRCLTTEEMHARNFGKTATGFWLAPIATKDRERLAKIRRGSEESKASQSCLADG
jgi:hypothetical protein